MYTEFPDREKRIAFAFFLTASHSLLVDEVLHPPPNLIIDKSIKIKKNVLD
jgi:hypothetical protein